MDQVVTNERRARRRWRNSRHDHYWDKWQEASRAKQKIIAEAKRKQFREAIAEAAEGNSIWRLAKWGRTKAQLPPELPIMPTLTTSEGQAVTFQEKAEALRGRFYPRVEADLSDIHDTSFSLESFPRSAMQVDKTTSREEVETVLKSSRPFKAPGRDGIPTGFLKALGPRVAEAIANLASACWKHSHYPQQFKEARTIVLRKPRKPIYTDLGAWRPIALINTIGKVIEALIARRLSAIAKEYHLLPDIQMGGRKGRSTETALELLTEQIHTIWTSKKHVATLLSIDISGAFDTVNHIRLLDILRKKGLPTWIILWVQAFLKNRSTSLVFQGQETPLFQLEAGVPQGSPLSPILFLYYNASLLELCNQPERGLSSIGFADDINLLIYSPSTEANCRKLERVHKKLLTWARHHGMKFAPKKYELIHFSRCRRFNLRAGIRLEGETKTPSPDIRILGI